MNVIGIDFGTVSNKIGCFDKYGLRIITNNHKNTGTPSVAFLIHPDNWIFGERALKLGINKVDKFIFDTKIMVGRKFNDNIIQSKIKNCWPFKIKNEQDNIKIVIHTDGKNYEFYPYQIIGLILKNLLQVSKINDFSQIIISIPAICDKNQISDLTKAIEFAEIHNFFFQTEPILASIAYLYGKKIKLIRNYNILIYDLGSSHLDVSIIQIHDETYEIFTEHGDINGKQFDDNIYKYVEEQMRKKYKQKVEFLGQPKINSILHQKCEEAKIILSEIDEVEIILEDEDQLNFTLTLDKFNEINNELFERSMKPVQRLIEKVKLNQESINDLFLIGGSTYIKKIQQLLFDTTKKVPSPYVDPREAVAMGACIAGAWMNKKKKENQINFNPIIDILMSKFNEMQTLLNSEENDRFLIEPKEKVSPYYTENKNQNSLKQINLPNLMQADSSDSEINYFWNKKQKPKEKENKQPSANLNDSLNLDENTNQNKSLSISENSPKLNEKNGLIENIESDSQTPKLNYFWFNTNGSPESKRNQNSIKQEKSDNSIAQNDKLNKNEKDDLLSNSDEKNESFKQKDKSSSNKNDLPKGGSDGLLSNSDEMHNTYRQKGKSRSNASSLLDDSKDDLLSNSDESLKPLSTKRKPKSNTSNMCKKSRDDSSNLNKKQKTFRQKDKPKSNNSKGTAKGIPLYVCLKTEDNQSSQSQIKKSLPNDNPKSEIKPSQHKSNSVNQPSKKSPTKAKQDDNNSLGKDKNTNSNQNLSPRKSNVCDLFNQKESGTKSSPRKSNSAAQPSTKSPAKAKQDSNYSSEKDKKANSNTNDSFGQKEFNLNSEESNLNSNSPKVSIYPPVIINIPPKPSKKTNFNIYQNLIIDSPSQNNLNNQKNHNYASKANNIKQQNPINLNHSMGQNSNKKIFFKLHDS